MSDSVRPQRWQPTRLPHPWDSPGKNTGVGCHFLLQCMKVKSKWEVAQSVHGIFQARVLYWVAISSSRGSSQPRDPTCFSCIGRQILYQLSPREAHFMYSNGNPLQYSCLENLMDRGAWWAAVHGVTKSQARLSDFTFTFHFPALEKEMATHSSVLAWRIPGTGEPGGLPSMGSHRVGHDRSDLALYRF